MLNGRPQPGRPGTSPSAVQDHITLWSWRSVEERGGAVSLLLGCTMPPRTPATLHPLAEDPAAQAGTSLQVGQRLLSVHDLQPLNYCRAELQNGETVPP